MFGFANEEKDRPTLMFCDIIGTEKTLIQIPLCIS